jgi:hypothetical protein
MLVFKGIMKIKLIFIIQGLIILSLIFSGMQIIPFNFQTTTNASAGSSWVIDTKQDFYSGVTNNISITDTGELELDKRLRSIKDDYIDESKIDTKKNVFVNTSGKRACAIRNWITFEEDFDKKSDSGESGRPTSDGGHILVGTTSSGGVGTQDIWLLKTDDQPLKQWDKKFGGSEEDRGFFVQETSDGGYIITGLTKSYGAGKKDVWLIKTDSSGNMQWNETFGGTEDDVGNSVIQTSDGGYIVTGYTDSYGGGGIDVWLIKTNKTGSKEWSHTFGGASHDEGKTVQQTTDGGYIITGRTRSFSIIYDAWVIKTNETGIMQWNKTLGGTNYDCGNSIHQTSDSGYIVVGYTNSYGAGFYDVWLIKINDTGSEEWNKTFGFGNDDYGYYVNLTSDGGDTGVKEWNETHGGYYGKEVHQTKNGGYVTIGTCRFGSDADFYLAKTDNLGKVTSKSYGEIISTNLLHDQNATLMKDFDCVGTYSIDGSIKMQFSKDKNNWYDSAGSLNGWDELALGITYIDLSSLGWLGDEFYYKANFTVVNNEKFDTTLFNITFSFEQYFSFGTFESEQFNTNGNVNWQNINWVGTKNPNTDLLFQLRTTKTQQALSTADFVGPDGESSNYYTTSRTSIWSEHDNESWMQFKVYFFSDDNLNTPILDNVTLTYNYLPSAPILKTPQNDTWLTNNNPTFTWTFLDLDSSTQAAFQWQADDDERFTSIDYDSEQVNSDVASYSHHSSIPDGIWYWRVRTQDSDGAWGPFSIINKIKIDTSIKKPIDIKITPDYWTNTNKFTIDWATPSDLSGIKEGAYYYVNDSPPSSQDDGIWVFSKPFTLSKIPEGINHIHIWLEDNVGNKNYLSYSTGVLKLDKTPPQNLSISINDDSEFTNLRTVNLDLLADDTLSGTKEMSFSFDEFEWTPWEGFQKTRTITLPSGDGEKLVYLRVNDIANNSAIVSASIVLDKTPPHSISIKINDGAAETNSQLVILDINAIDDTSGLYQIALKSDANPWGGWENYTETKSYNLPSGDGVKTVYIKLMDKAGNIADPIKTTITLNTKEIPDDFDGDEYLDNEDAFPHDPTQWFDTDGDNYGDNPNGTDPDAFPNNSKEWNDLDGDNVGDNTDLYPEDPTKWKKDDDEPSDGKDSEKKAENDYIGLIIGVITIIIVIIILIYFLLIKRKKKEKIKSYTPSQATHDTPIPRPLPPHPPQFPHQPPPVQQLQPQTPPLQQNLCLNCGQQLTYIQNFNRYYCNQCQRYI